MRRLPFLLFVVISSFNVLTAQVIAEFTTSEGHTSCPPFLIHFLNNSSGTGTLTYSWDFGNGITSTQQNPSTTFSNPGKYTVRLIVSNGIDVDTIVKNDYIEIFTPPKALYQPSDIQTICAPSDIHYQNLTIVGSSPIEEYLWDFGDGFVSNEENPIHTYKEAGFYTPSLTVRDKNGCFSSLSIDNQIKSYKPKADFLSDVNSSCEGSLDVGFINLSNGAGKLNYLWLFGDSTSSVSGEVRHLYKKPGKYDVSLKVTDDYGCSDTIVKSKYIIITEISPSFILPNDTVCADVLLQFLNTSTNSSIYKWDFGDGVISTQKNPKHKFAKPGEYSVSLYASNGTCGGTLTQRIVVEHVKADFHPYSNYGCEIPLLVNYINTSENAVSYEWHFGNGTISTIKNPTNEIMMSDSLITHSRVSYSDTLLVTSARGCKSKMVLDSSVVIILPKVNFTPNSKVGAKELSGCIPLTVNFKDVSTYNSPVDKIVSYNWTFSDVGKPSRSDKEFTEIFTKEASTEVTLKVTTEKGCVAQNSQFVLSGEKQIPSFKLLNSSNIICASEVVDFENTSYDLNRVHSSTWMWGDGLSESMGNSHVYTKTGPMSVTLKLNSYGCVTSLTKDNFLTIKGPIAKFGDSIDCVNPFERTFIVNNLDAKTYTVDLGDGTVIQNQAHIKHTYNSSGDYIAKLIAINDECSFSADPIYVKIRNVKSDIKTSFINQCPSSLINFNSSRTIDEDKWMIKRDTAIYLWNFGDKTSMVFAKDTIVSHQFKERGDYKVTLVTKDINLCPDTAVFFQHIFQPVTNFDVAYSNGCLPINYTFTDKSKADALSVISSYKWSFGDGQTSTSINPTHSYHDWGNYSITLITTDNMSCSDTLIKSDIVTAEYPNPTFVANDTTVCKGDTVKFANIDPSKIASYLWTFPDNTTSTLSNPKFVFTNDGGFDVKLYIVDKHGCDSLGVQANYIKVQKPPVVDFVADPLITKCYPSQITFTDQSVSDYLGGWKWSFGDVNGYSYRQNPQHVYTRPGQFDIKLVASTTYGCSDSIIKNSYVNPKGPYAEIVTNDTVCRDVATSLQMIKSFNVYDYKWDLGDGSVQEGSDEISHTYLQVGRFYPGLFLISDTLHSCDKFIIDTIYVSETLAKYKLNNTNPFGCEPFEVSYSNISTQSDEWKWDFGNGTTSTSFSATELYSTNGTYFGRLSVKNKLGCTDSILLTSITVYPLPTVTLTPDHFICRNSATLLEATGGISYDWTPKLGLSDPDLASTSASPDTTTQYKVMVTDSNGCMRNDSMIIVVQQIPVPQLADTTIIVGEAVSLDLTSDDIKSYFWEPDYNISCITCPNPEFKPLKSTTYYLTVTDTADCFTIKTPVNFSVELKYSVDVPTAFTPNGDGINDEVYVNGWGIKELITFRIFNQLGVMIFETNDINNAWTGKGSGITQPNETFQYIVKVRSYDDNIITKTGTIKIIK